jgi:hypothetical protein
MSVGRANESFAPIGSNLPDCDNYFWRDCRRIVHVRKGSPGFRACPTLGCTRPTGFGSLAKTSRPRARGCRPMDEPGGRHRDMMHLHHVGTRTANGGPW